MENPASEPDTGQSSGDAPSSRGPLPWPREDDRLLPFLPMVYVAWSDGFLSPEEMERVREELRKVERLPPDACRIVESWLNPDAPPSAVALAQLRRRIQAVASQISPDERRSLASLGAAMARTGRAEAGGWGTAAGIRALGGVEDVLGVLGGEAARELTATEDSAATVDPPPSPTLPVSDLTALLESDHRELRARVLKLLEDPEVRVPDGLATPEARERVLRAVRRIADEGLGSLAFPKAYGGQDNIPGSIAVFETLAYGNLSVLIKFGVQFGLFGGSIVQLGTASHHRRYLQAVGSLELPGIYAMTERNHGSNVRELETVARYRPESGEFEIHTPHPEARKDWLGNAALHGRMATVFAQLEVSGERHGVHAFLVPVRHPDGRPVEGVTIEDCGEKVGLHGVDNGQLTFTRVRIPRENLLDRFGEVTADGEYQSEITSSGRRFFTMLGTLVAGRVSIAAASISAAKTGLVIAVRYSSRRRQFGPSGLPEVPILNYLAQQRALLPPLATTYALHFAVRDLIRDYGEADDDEARSQVEVMAAGLKAFASRHAQDTLQRCREGMGGRGYLAANRIGTLREDTDVFTTFEGANVVLLQLVAKSLLAEYQDEMGDLRIWGVVKLLKERTGAEATRRNPVRSRRTSESFLRDPETHADAMRFRESRIKQTVARRLKQRIDDGQDSFEAMNECQDHLVALAEAHVERAVLERFHAAIDRNRDNVRPEITAALEMMADLFALSRIERDRAWFLESGYMEAVQTKAIRAMINELCLELRPSAVTLVDAFGIPEALIAAPDAVRPDHSGP